MNLPTVALGPVLDDETQAPQFDNANLPLQPASFGEFERWHPAGERRDEQGQDAPALGFQVWSGVH